MKMISTYISLLLLCGFMLLFYYCNTRGTRSRVIDPVAKKTRVAYKRTAPPTSLAVHLTKGQYSNSQCFSFFKDVAANILPVLKKLN